MKHRPALAFIAVVFGILCRIGPTHAKDFILLADRWCPYNCDPQSDHPGFAVEIVKTAFAPLDRAVVYRTMNWSRSLMEARAGSADAIIGMGVYESSGFILPHEPIGVSVLGMAVRSDSQFRYTGPRSLEGKVLGLVAGYAFGGACGDYIRKHESDRALVQVISGEDGLATNLRKLQAGRIDVVVDDANVLAHAISLLGPSADLKLAATADGSLSLAPVYIAFSPAQADAGALSHMLDSAIKRMRASGQLAAILARYGLRDWK